MVPYDPWADNTVGGEILAPSESAEAYGCAEVYLDDGCAVAHATALKNAMRAHKDCAPVNAWCIAIRSGIPRVHDFPASMFANVFRLCLRVFVRPTAATGMPI